MGKVVKAIAIVAAVAVVVFAPQISATLLAAIAVKSAIAAALVTAALAVGAAMALRALTAKALTPSSQGGPPQVFRQSIANSFIVYGKRRVGGLLVFFHAAESGGDYFRYFVIAAAGHRCQGVTQWYLNDEVVTVDGSNMVTSGPYAGAAWLWFQRGLAAETANATFVAECGGKWTTDHKGSGIAAIYAKFEMTEDVVQAGMPNITAEIEGRDEVLDTRTSLTGYTRNGALIIYDWLKIPREEGGFGAYHDEIPDDAYVSAQANVCDETVEGEPRYALDAVIATGAPPIEVRDSLILNCAGSYTYSGGKHKVRVGYFVPVSESLSEDDLAGPVQVERFLPGDVAANQVQGTFIDPAGGYQGAAFATQTASPAPTDIKQLDLDLAFVTNKHQAERVAAIMLKRALAEIRVTWPMNVEGLKVEALDTVQAATSRYGLSNYAFTVAGWGLSSDFGVVLSLREENEDIYDPPTPVAPPSVPSVSPGSPINPTTDAGSVSFPPSGNISADTVQGAIEELDAEKVPNSRALTAGAGLTGGGDLSADRTFAISANGVTDTLLRDSAALSVIGRSANSAGDPADIAAGSDGHVLRRSGTTLGFGTVATLGLADDAVTFAKIQDVATAKVLGRATAGSGNVEEISTTGTGNVVLSASPTLTGTFSAAAGTMSGLLTLNVTAATRETALKATSSDAGNDAFYIANFTATANRFQPAITGFVDSADNLSSLNFSGAVLAARDTAGDGGLGVVNFRAAIVDSATDPVNGSFSALTNRTLFSFRNQATNVFAIEVGGTTTTGKVAGTTWLKSGSYTVATVPSAATAAAGSRIYVSNEAGGAVLAFSDGTNWRRVTDRAIIS